MSASCLKHGKGAKNERKWELLGSFARACAGVVVSVFPGFGCGCCRDVGPRVWGEARGVPAGQRGGRDAGSWMGSLGCWQGLGFAIYWTEKEEEVCTKRL